MIILSNAFSISMLPEFPANIIFEKLSDEEVKNLLAGGFRSTVGHSDVARIIAERIGMEVPVCRDKTILGKNDILVVAQYIGPRLPEGATSLPEGARIEFFKVYESE